MAFMTNDGWTSISIFTGVSFMKGFKERMTEGLVYMQLGSSPVGKTS